MCDLFFYFFEIWIRPLFVTLSPHFILTNTLRLIRHEHVNKRKSPSLYISCNKTNLQNFKDVLALVWFAEYFQKLPNVNFAKSSHWYVRMECWCKSSLGVKWNQALPFHRYMMYMLYFVGLIHNIFHLYLPIRSVKLYKPNIIQVHMLK